LLHGTVLIDTGYHGCTLLLMLVVLVLPLLVPPRCCHTERDAQLAELQREARQFAQKEATWQRSQKALEAQVLWTWGVACTSQLPLLCIHSQVCSMKGAQCCFTQRCPWFASAHQQAQPGGCSRTLTNASNLQLSVSSTASVVYDRAQHSPVLLFLSWVMQVERHRRTAEAAREALGRKETELKEQAAAGVKADKDRWVQLQQCCISVV
jgi:hypothetical protein